MGHHQAIIWLMKVQKQLRLSMKQRLEKRLRKTNEQREKNFEQIGSVPVFRDGVVARNRQSHTVNTGTALAGFDTNTKRATV